MNFIPLIILLVLFCLNIPIAYSLMVSVLYYFMFCNTTLAPFMIFQKMVAQGESFFGGQNVAAYSASKGGVVQLTKALSNEWMPRGINVNAIAPGYMETELSHDLMVSEVGARITGRIPAGRWGRGEDMKGVTAFLASAASDYLSGNVIQVDGGFLCS